MAGKLEINDRSTSENLPSPEYTLTIPYITISGRSGTGKSHAAEKLAVMFGILPENNIKTGALFRKLLEDDGVLVQGFAHRDPSFDQALDEKQKELMQTATIQEPRIIEGRLAGIIHREITNEMQEKNIQARLGVSVLVIGDKEVREQRQVDREMKEGADPKNIVDKNFERDTGDFEFWQEMHPALLSGKTIEDLYDATIIKGKPHNNLYDLVIDTTHLTIDQVTNTLVELFVQKGYTR